MLYCHAWLFSRQLLRCLHALEFSLILHYNNEPQYVAGRQTRGASQLASSPVLCTALQLQGVDGQIGCITSTLRQFMSSTGWAVTKKHKGEPHDDDDSSSLALKIGPPCVKILLTNSTPAALQTSQDIILKKTLLSFLTHTRILFFRVNAPA